MPYWRTDNGLRYMWHGSRSSPRDPDGDESHALQGITSEFGAGGQAPVTTTTTG